MALWFILTSLFEEFKVKLFLIWFTLTGYKQIQLVLKAKNHRRDSASHTSDFRNSNALSIVLGLVITTFELFRHVIGFELPDWVSAILSSSSIARVYCVTVCVAMNFLVFSSFSNDLPMVNSASHLPLDSNLDLRSTSSSSPPPQPNTNLGLHFPSSSSSLLPPPPSNVRRTSPPQLEVLTPLLPSSGVRTPSPPPLEVRTSPSLPPSATPQRSLEVQRTELIQGNIQKLSESIGMGDEAESWTEELDQDNYMTFPVWIGMGTRTLRERRKYGGHRDEEFVQIDRSYD